MYKIGEFSKIVDIPVRTLRYYDECGILQPNEIDNFTGYRYYTDNNVIECEIIKLLKSVNFTLEEIALYRNNLNPEIIEQKQHEIIEQIEFLRKKYNRLAIMKEELQKSQTKIKMYEKIESENEEEKVLRRKYERRNIKKSA